MAVINGWLGNSYSPESTRFKVWAPYRDKIELMLYQDPQGVFRRKYKMDKDDKGVHHVTISGDLKGMYYTYLIDQKYEITDPYAVASSLNSTRSAIIDLKDTNPEGWESHRIPQGEEDLCKGVIYELHIKDFTFDKSSGVKDRGKYLGMVEKGTNYNGHSTGIDHLIELGVTHVQLMPVFDFLTVNEEERAFHRNESYNWGYDPEHYNIPEGSYSTNPSSPTSRIKELKSLIMGLHQAGIKVIMDVVYNHTYRSVDSNFNILYPGYYYRMKEDGTFSDGSGCGNELATENPMVRKFIIDSLKFWVEEYKIDGFRFDLMALINVDTVKEIKDELNRNYGDIILYGEPWTAGSTILPSDKTTTKGTQKGKGFALFNDDFRNAIKGDNNGYTKGFSQGDNQSMLAVETGLIGSINYDNEHMGFTNQASETINYINSHDNLILYDKMKKVFPSENEEELVRYNKFAMGILFTSQGIPLIHAGNEFLRSKQMQCNTYNLPLTVNAVDWRLKERNFRFFNYMKDLIFIKKKYEEFALKLPDEIKQRVKFLYMKEQGNLIAYTIKSKENKYLLIIHNGNPKDFTIAASSIRDHIQEKYSENIKELSLKRLFDINGLVLNGGKQLVNNKVNIEGISSSIVEVSYK